MRGGRQLPLLGRGAELASALEVVDRVPEATGQALFIEGEAGIGKTRLLDEVLQAAEDRGFTVARGAGRQLETELPFAPLVGALQLFRDTPDERRAAVGRLLVEEPPDPAPGLGSRGTHRQMQVVHAIAELIEDLCEGGALVLALEDAHWIDGPSLAVVDRLARLLAHLPLLVVVTARPYPRSPELHGLLDRLLTVGAVHLPLVGLPEVAVAELARGVLGAEPGRTVLAGLDAVAGNPLFATELLVALQDDGAIAVRDGIADLRAAQVPPSLRLTVLRRLSALPERTVELLQLAAVLGAVFEPAALAAVMGRSEVDAVRDVEPALRAGLVAGVEGGLAFHHDLVRDAVYEDLPEAVRDALHAGAARALADAGYPAEVTAPHLLRGALPGDAQTVANLRQVARRLGTRAPDLAVQLLERAVELADRGSRDALWVELARTLGWAQRPDDAAALADELLERLDVGPLARTALLVRVLQAQFLGGLERFGERLEAAATEPDASPGERARLLALAAAAWVYGDDLGRAEAVGKRAIDAARRAADDIALCAALVSMALAAQTSMDDGHGGHVPAGVGRLAISRAREAVDVARRSDDPELPLVVAPAVVLAMILGTFPQHRAEAIELCQRGLVDAEERGSLSFAYAFHMALGVNLYRAGRWDEAATELESAVERCLELDATGSGLLDSCCRLARIAVRRDDVAGAERWIARAEAAQGAAPPTVYASPVVLARATLLEATGDPHGARELLVGFFTTAPASVQRSVAYVIGVPLIRLVSGQDRRCDVARAVLAVLDDDETDPTVPWLRGVLDHDVALVREALARARTHGIVIQEELPLLLEDLADLLAEVADASDHDPAVLITEAADLWDVMGAVREVDRLESRLRDLGVHRGKRGGRRRPETGWEALTETEQRVVDLVAERLVYREVGERMFISRRTVETHIVHVFAKLGVSNRRELEAAYAEREASTSRSV